MAWGSSHHRSRVGRCQASSSRDISAAENLVGDYHAHTPLEIQAEIDLAKADVQVLKHYISNEEVTDTTRS